MLPSDGVCKRPSSGCMLRGSAGGRGCQHEGLGGTETGVTRGATEACTAFVPLPWVGWAEARGGAPAVGAACPALPAPPSCPHCAPAHRPLSPPPALKSGPGGRRVQRPPACPAGSAALPGPGRGPGAQGCRKEAEQAGLVSLPGRGRPGARRGGGGPGGAGGLAGALTWPAAGLPSAGCEHLHVPWGSGERQAGPRVGRPDPERGAGARDRRGGPVLPAPGSLSSFGPGQPPLPARYCHCSFSYVRQVALYETCDADVGMRRKDETRSPRQRPPMTGTS